MPITTWEMPCASWAKRKKRLESLKRAVSLRPQYADAYNNLGITYSRVSKYDEAQQSFEEAIRLRPDHAAAHNNLGIALTHQNLHDKAIASYQQALRVKPDYSEAHNNLAIVLTQSGRHAEADAAYRRALELKPNYAEAHSNWGIALTEMGRTDEALEHYGQALDLRQEYPDAHMNRALTWLLRGDFDRGWEEYEWRWQCKEFNPRPFRQPRWQGEPLDGKRILLHSEQGLGDTFQFVRYTKLVKERGGTVVMRCPKPLAQILRRCPWIDQLCIEGGELPDFDVHLPLLSLPWIFGTRLTNVPNDTPYLFADPALVAHWQRELSYMRAFRIGINWQGNPRYRGDLRRSIPLADLRPGRRAWRKAHFPAARPGNRANRRRPLFRDAAGKPDRHDRRRLHGHGRDFEKPRPRRDFRYVAGSPGRSAGRNGLDGGALFAGLALAACTAKTAPGIPPCDFSGKRSSTTGRWSSKR